MVYKHIGKYIKFRDPSVLAFAFWYTPVAVDHGWALFSPSKEYERMGLADPACRWRISECNLNYAVCDSYPELLCVPKDFTDQNVRTVAKFRVRSLSSCVAATDRRSESQPLARPHVAGQQNHDRLCSARPRQPPLLVHHALLDAARWRYDTGP
jgi:hypothetical protein